MARRIAIPFLVLPVFVTGFCLAEEPLVDKTLVVWAAPANLSQRGGAALTIDANGIDRFDGIVFGELELRVWMPGSNGFMRTEQKQADWPKETAGPDEFVQIAIVYRGREVTVYRNRGGLRGVHDEGANPMGLVRSRSSCSAPVMFTTKRIVLWGGSKMHASTRSLSSKSPLLP